MFSRTMLGLSLVLLSSQAAHAARLLTYTITVDGKTWKKGIYSDNGTGDAAAVWSYLHKVRFQQEEGSQDVEKRDDPLRTKLKGEIRLRAEQSGRVIAEARLSELLLVRTDASKDEWSLPPEEVDRTAKAAGLASPITEKGSVYWDVSLWTVIALLLGMIIFRLMRGAPPADSANRVTA
jgi:hypothetical protein